MANDVTGATFCSASGVFDIVAVSSPFLSSDLSCVLAGVARELAVSVIGFDLSSSLGACNK